MLYLIIICAFLTFFNMDAKLDTLQEIATECFKNYREYSEPLYRQGYEIFTEPKSVLTHEDFEEILNLFNTAMQKPPCNIAIKPEKVKEHGNRFKEIINIDQHAEKIRIDPGSKICFIGDIHGSLHSLLRSLLRLVAIGYLKNDFSIPEDKKFYMVFTGDFVDRGRYGIEVIYTLLKLKLKNMNRVFLLKGNHETSGIYNAHGFVCEVMFKFKDLIPDPSDLSDKRLANLMQTFDNFCRLLPLVLFIGSGQDTKNGNDPFWIQCCHGGFEPTLDPSYVKTFLHNNDFILNLKNKLYNDPIETMAAQNFKAEFSFQEGGIALNNGFTWCDFDENSTIIDELSHVKNRGYMVSGAGITINKYLNKYNLQAIFRGHQHADFGLKIGGKTHWARFAPELDLPTQVKNTQNGFAISTINYPVFTFSTGSEGVVLPYDCLGLLTTEQSWNEWRLLPLEFSLPTNRNGKYLKITNLKKMANPGQDPIEIDFTTIAEAEPVPMSLFFKLKLEDLKSNLQQTKEQISLLQNRLGVLKKLLLEIQVK